jgi:peptidyl-dipeptidase Dcp
VYEVREGDRLVALFLSDNYARQFKRSGAWMSEFRSQHKNNEEVG